MSAPSAQRGPEGAEAFPPGPRVGAAPAGGEGEGARSTCPFCLKQFNDLGAHQAQARHSAHDPACGHCGKHFKALLSLRVHLEGDLGKGVCVAAFAERGCRTCLRFLPEGAGAGAGAGACPGGCKVGEASPFLGCGAVQASLPPPWRGGLSDISNQGRVASLPPPRPAAPPPAQAPGGIGTSASGEVGRAVAMDCEMVGTGRDGAGSTCARVCLVSESGEVLLDTFVQPTCRVTDYRTAITGIVAADLASAPKLREVRRRVAAVLAGCAPGAGCGRGCKGHGPPRILVGHDLRHDLKCLGMEHPEQLKRDTATYPPLTKTCGSSHKLRDLARVYLGWGIQEAGRPHDPAEDAAAAMALYRFMRAARPGHKGGAVGAGPGPRGAGAGGALGEGMEGERPWFECWCGDD